MSSSDRAERRITALSKRILGKMTLFAEEASGDALENDAWRGRLLGVYSSQGGDRVGVTTEGIHAEGLQPPFVAYKEMGAIHAPPKGPNAGDIELVLDDGVEVRLSIRGGDARFRDVYEFTRFLMRSAATWREDSDESTAEPGSAAQ